ncbi:MAG TPA: HEAT repeat domain-containing protein [Planctomycetota bacterium]|nr:HEAT repeat domain-containing protein [Planctomycetota bacterium]
MRPLAALLLLATAALAQELGGDADKPETDAAVIEQKVKSILEEYDAIARNQDLVQTRRRRELAKRLGLLPHPDSVKALLRMVEDDADLRTRVVAMYSIARIGDLKAIKRMYRKVKEESTARDSVLADYLGPALARATDPAIGPWIVDEVLPSSNKLLRLSAIEAVGRLRTAEAADPLLRLLEKERRKSQPDPHFVHETLRALGQIGGDAANAVVLAAATDPDWRYRLASAEVLLYHVKDEKGLEAMRNLLKDETPIVRETAVIAAGREKVEPLFAEMILVMREGNLRSKRAAYEALCATSGQDYGYAPDVWDKWWQDKKKGNVGEAGELKDREHITVATYYDFKIFSDRILFVVDVSGSMEWPESKAGDPNRIAVAKRELVKAIKALDEKTLFNVATFAGHVSTWKKDGEVPANEANKKAALAWIEGALLPRGATNTYGALIEGFERNPLIDTIFFLSDGIPSTGKYEVPEEILIKLRYANRFRRVIINTIALAIGKPAIEKAEKYEDPEEMAAFMRLLAEWNGGTCVDIRTPYLNLK